MLKKAALLCSLVVLVSIVSVFAASNDTPLKTQTKTQLKTQDLIFFLTFVIEISFNIVIFKLLLNID